MDSLYLALGLFFLYSFFGWLAEVAFSAVSRKKFVNTGFLTGPVCPIYGVGILFILRFLEPLRNDLFFLFVGSTVVATVLEYATNRFSGRPHRYQVVGITAGSASTSAAMSACRFPPSGARVLLLSSAGSTPWLSGWCS